MKSKFATVINCMDGRVQDPVNEWMKARTGATFIDVITEAGPDRIMASTATASRLILKRILVSRDSHGSKEIALVAHHDCAGNPVSKAKHLEHLVQSGKIMATWSLGMTIHMLWVDKNGGVELISSIDS
ncbi:MAG: hypothetical protein K9M55_08195 [Candidatus Marinimicrobia bacterium]|nr:hypothetical protein [Candidatus Neomarinimicrobiota bacterium]MCF7922668.1 hypothetical protein [Candidatus Neomarinimicrobiota bacterium]